jgi:hypothetical protein
MTPPRNFWPLDFDLEDEIFDNLFWDLPGRMKFPKTGQQKTRRKRDVRPVGASS